MLLELVGLDKVETRLEEIRGDVDDAVEGVRSFAALRKYNATHSVFGTRYYSSQEDYKRDLQVSSSTFSSSFSSSTSSSSSSSPY